MPKDFTQYESDVNNFFENLQEEDFEEAKCIFCGDSEQTILLFNKATMRVHRCRCGFVYNKRQSNDAALTRFYETSNALNTWAKIKESEPENRRQEEKFSLAVSMIENNFRNSVLDIGCGNGKFLSMISNDMRRVGTDLNEAAIKMAKEKGIDAEILSTEDTFKKYKGEIFDNITLWGVLEHHKDPLWLLNECWKLLNYKGKIFICVPNISSMVAETLGKKCFTYCPQHLWYFTNATLTEILSRNGFKKDWVHYVEDESIPIAKHTAGLNDPYKDISNRAWLVPQVNSVAIKISESMKHEDKYKIIMAATKC